MKNIYYLFISILFMQCSSDTPSEVNIVPFPQKVEVAAGTLDLSQGFTIKGNCGVNNYLNELLVSEYSVSPNDKGIIINLNLVNGNTNPEAYKLVADSKGIHITASADNGIFYGVQTLRQLIKEKKVPHVTIEDAPKYSWRSYMLDDARHFQGRETVKKMLDEMALLKMNTFQWHLTDDAGWRIEIKKYPLLTEIGARRDSSQINVNGQKFGGNFFDGKVHEGYYSQNDIREIVKYASDRFITIIPEINMPGHASAAVASYHWLGTSKAPVKTPEIFGVKEILFNVGKPEVMTFMHDVLKEVSELFPSEVIHIGGDEVRFRNWEGIPEISQYMKTHKLKNYSDVQVQFTNDISNYISHSLGKRMMGWNEILGRQVHVWSNQQNAETSLSSDAIVQFWHGEAEDLQYAIDKGHQVINSNRLFTYLDYEHNEINIQKTYNFEPIPQGLSKEKAEKITGVGCQMWGEWTPTAKEVEAMTFPRIAAIAEVGWIEGENKNYERFRKALTPLMQYWKDKGYNITSIEDAEQEITNDRKDG